MPAQRPARARGAHQPYTPSRNLASSLIFSGDQGGSKTSCTSTRRRSRRHSPTCLVDVALDHRPERAAHRGQRVDDAHVAAARARSRRRARARRCRGRAPGPRRSRAPADRADAPTGSGRSPKKHHSDSIKQSVMTAPRLRYPVARARGRGALLRRLGRPAPLRLEPAEGRANLVELHGPLMVFGFLGTVISLERAVALRRPWGYLAPAGTIAGAALLLAGVRAGVGELVLLLAGCVLVALFVVILRAHATASAATLLLGRAALDRRRRALAARRPARPGGALVGRLPRADDRRRAARAGGDGPPDRASAASPSPR